MVLTPTGGKTFAELDREDTLREAAMSTPFLCASQFTSVRAFGVATMAMGVGLCLVLIAIAPNAASKTPCPDWVRQPTSLYEWSHTGRRRSPRRLLHEVVPATLDGRPADPQCTAIQAAQSPSLPSTCSASLVRSVHALAARAT